MDLRPTGTSPRIDPVPVTVIVNRVSGSADGDDLQSELHALFDAGGCPAEVRMVENEDIGAIVRRAVAGGTRVIVAGGGDGTVSAVAAEVAGTDATLGVLPLGTLNHFAKDLGIPLELKESVETIVAGHAIDVDIAAVNDRTFINNSSIGLYPRLVQEREDRRERHGLGKWGAFALALVATLADYRLLDLHLEIDGATRRISSPFVFVGNNEYRVEGLALGTRERVDAGRLCLFVAHRAGRLRLLMLTLRALLGGLSKVSDFDSFTATCLRVETGGRSIDVATDGEVTRLKAPLEYTLRSRALRVIVPEERKE